MLSIRVVMKDMPQGLSKRISFADISATARPASGAEAVGWVPGSLSSIDGSHSTPRPVSVLTVKVAPGISAPRMALKFPRPPGRASCSKNDSCSLCCLVTRSTPILAVLMFEILSVIGNSLFKTLRKVSSSLSSVYVGWTWYMTSLTIFPSSPSQMIRFKVSRSPQRGGR